MRGLNCISKLSNVAMVLLNFQLLQLYFDYLFTANKYAPQFSKSYVEVQVGKHLDQTNVVGKVVAMDGDNLTCTAGLKCPCAEVEYNVIDGADDTFDVDSKTGNIVLRSPPFKDDYVLEIGAKNAELSEYGNELVIQSDNKLAKQYVHVDTRNYAGEKTNVAHSRQRRAVSFTRLLI